MGSNGPPSTLQPTFEGYVESTQDALILFESCLGGSLSHVPRRPHDRERSTVIRSGSVFIYEENASGIKRWTDGIAWSPSRILGNFLVYRELSKPFPPGEKKRATKKSKRPTRPGEPYPRNDTDTPAQSEYSPTTPTAPSFSSRDAQEREEERVFVGSLVDSYGFKDGGLIKKTMSVNVNGVQHHLVSYYSLHDVRNKLLPTPTSTWTLRHVKIRPELTTRQNFRAPLDDKEDGFNARLYEPRDVYGKNPMYSSQPYTMHMASQDFSYPTTTLAGYGNVVQPNSGTAYGARQPSVPNPYYPLHLPPSSQVIPATHSLPKMEHYNHAGVQGDGYHSRFEALNGHTNSMDAANGQAADRIYSPTQSMAYQTAQTQQVYPPRTGVTDDSMTSDLKPGQSLYMNRAYAPATASIDASWTPAIPHTSSAPAHTPDHRTPIYKLDRQHSSWSNNTLSYSEHQQQGSTPQLTAWANSAQ